MDEQYFKCVGEVGEWPSKEKMADILRQGGLDVYVGQYSVRVKNCSRFVFQEYGGDLGEPCLDADGDSLEGMKFDAALVSKALAQAGVSHCFTVCDDQWNEYCSFEHKWGDV